MSVIGGYGDGRRLDCYPSHYCTSSILAADSRSLYINWGCASEIPSRNSFEEYLNMWLYVTRTYVCSFVQQKTSGSPGVHSGVGWQPPSSQTPCPVLSEAQYFPSGKRNLIFWDKRRWNHLSSGVKSCSAKQSYFL